MQIPHHIVAGVAFAPGAHVHEVGDDGLRVVRVGELKRALAYEHVGRWDADERSGRGIGEESSAIPVEDENSIHKGVEDLQIFFLQTGVAGRDDADDLHLREGGCGDCHGEDRAIMADQIDWVVPGCLLPADQADEFLPLRSIRPYSGEGEGMRFSGVWPSILEKVAVARVILSVWGLKAKKPAAVSSWPCSGGSGPKVFSFVIVKEFFVSISI